MTSLPAVFLLDLDGVLVQPGGYRRAVSATVNFFTRRLGWGDLAPGEETMALFESQGITNEWDMIPICLGTAFETVLEAFPETGLPADLEALQPVPLPVRLALPDYETHILQAARLLQPGRSPAEAIFYAGERCPFPRLSGRPLFTGLFSRTQDVLHSAATRVFQNYVLGSQAFQDIYHARAEVETASFLQQFDTPLLSAETREAIGARSGDGLLLAAYTARPSLAPRGIETPGSGYSPEAELALDLVGLPQIPLMGFGRLLFTANRLGLSPNLLIKPSPFQALAAVLAALSGDELVALEMAVSICRAEGILPGRTSPPFSEGEPRGDSGTLPVPAGTALKGEMPGSQASLSQRFSLNGALTVHVFEDSPAGIRAVQRAGEILNRAGIPVTVNAWGIASHPVKIRSLEAAGAVVCPDINQAVQQVL